MIREFQDFHNWSLERCKEEVLSYQQTKEAKYFHNLLARFDRYILYVLYEMRKTNFYLRNEEMQELYHTGILGFHKGLCAFKPHLDPFFLILVIKAYIKSEVKQTYSYKSRESGIESVPVLFEESEIARELDIFMLFELLETSLEFTPRDRQLVHMRFKEDKSVEVIAEHFDITEIAVYKQLGKIIDKLKKTLHRELQEIS